MRKDPWSLEIQTMACRLKPYRFSWRLWITLWLKIIYRQWKQQNHCPLPPKLTMPNDSESAGQLEPSHIAGKMQNCTATLENSCAVLYKVKQKLTIWSSNLTPRYIYQGEMKICIHTKTCMQVFVVTLFIVFKDLKPTCPSSGEWINNQIMEYY